MQNILRANVTEDDILRAPERFETIGRFQRGATEIARGDERLVGCVVRHEMLGPRVVLVASGPEAEALLAAPADPEVIDSLFWEAALVALRTDPGLLGLFIHEISQESYWAGQGNVRGAIKNALGIR